jgi:periplasmic divalent cation tolerance protein
MSEEIFWIYVTARDEKEAAKIGRAVVAERLAACVNILGKIRSFYWWDDRVIDGREVAMIAKTRASLLKKFVARVKELHSYECPCIVALPLAGGNPDFFEWLRNQTKQPKRKSDKS